MHVIAAKAVAFKEALTDDFKEYTAQIIRNSQALAAALTSRGYKIISGGTDNHCMLVDLRNKGVTGKQAEIALDAAGITCNKNMVPYDDQPALVTSGIRLGTAAITTRGMVQSDMETIAGLIDRVIAATSDEANRKAVKNDVKALCAGFPLTSELPHINNAANGFLSGNPMLQSGLDRLQSGAAVAAETAGSLLEKIGGELKTAFNKK
jgi:glycine hydroxymethyltransferase